MLFCGLSERLRRFMESGGLVGEFVELPPEQARTSESAANAVGCELGQIAKSIVLKGSRTYVVVLAGDRRIDLKKFSKVVGEPVRLAKPDEVLSETGYPVGAVPPFGHIRPLKTFIDASLLRHKVVYASGGSDSFLLKLGVDTLLNHFGDSVVDVSR
uniref:Hypothetical conserved protein n=1 Tax=Caldiarchaeum subterraneum TaxID=311458 RepID=Q4LED9_CALS0|nr:hypothetical conserved protein [Candidatus Caldarchaeum subterraneum]